MLTTNQPQITIEKVENAPVKAGTHKFAWLRITNLTPHDNTIRLTPGDIGMKRIQALCPRPLGEPFTVAWDGDAMNPGLVFDGWQEGETRVLVEAWGL